MTMSGPQPMPTAAERLVCKAPRAQEWAIYGFSSSSPSADSAGDLAQSSDMCSSE